MPRDYVSIMHGEENTPFVTEYEGEKHYFYSEECKMSYDRYLQNMMVWPRNFLPNTDNETHKLVLPEVTCHGNF